MSAAYDGLAHAYARHRGGHAYVVDALVELSGRAIGGPSLEVGCGTAVYARALADATGRRGAGLDPSADMLSRVPRGEGLSLAQGRASALPFRDAAFSMIFSVNVVHHLRELSAYFGEAFRVLAPGGIFCTATDSEAIIRRRNPLSRYWPETVDPELARYHAIESIDRALAAAGFDSPTVREASGRLAISDAGAFRDKAFSCLGLIPDAAFRRGLRDLEADLRAGPLEGRSELAFVCARRP